MLPKGRPSPCGRPCGSPGPSVDGAPEAAHLDWHLGIGEVAHDLVHPGLGQHVVGVVVDLAVSIDVGTHSIEEWLVRMVYDELWKRWNDDAVDDVLHTALSFAGPSATSHAAATHRVLIGTWFAQPSPTTTTRSSQSSLRLVLPRLRLEYRGHHHGLLLGTVLTGAWVLGDLDALRRQIAAH